MITFSNQTSVNTAPSFDDAQAAYRRGDLAIDDPIVVLGNNPMPRRK